MIRVRTISDEDAMAILEQKRCGASMKDLAAANDVTRQCLWIRLRAIGAIRSRKLPSWVRRTKGIAKVHLSETIYDLDDLLHHFVLEGQATLRTLAKVIGSSDDTAWRHFYRIQERLARCGIRFEKHHEPGDHSRFDARLVFNARKLLAFVKRELPHAEATLKAFKKKHGVTGRFRGNEKEEDHG